MSSPSGGGKTTVIKKILETDPDHYVYSISLTTRPKRRNEVDGRDYYFVSKKEFEEKIKAGELLEYEEVHGQYYGTPRKPLITWIEKGYVVLLDIDVYGAQNVRKQFEKALLIFLKPPDMDVLVERLKNRSTESEEQIQKRLDRLPEEMKYATYFDHVIVNENLNDTVHKVKKIIDRYR